MRPLPKTTTGNSLNRRQILSSGCAAIAATACIPHLASGSSNKESLAVGQAVVDTTPPLGIELAGFHKAAGNERRITGIRQKSTAKAIVIRVKGQTIAIVSLDILTVSAAFTAEVQQQVAEKTGIPALNVRVCATHTHSMPTFTFLRQWGALPKEYQQQTLQAVVKAVQQAQQDLTDAELYVGKSAVVGGNFNRTTSTWKTEKQFDKQSTDAERWLDTNLHLLRFERAGKEDVLWYHFSSHPVCFRDTESGPDWVGLVAEKVHAKTGVTPGFMQGHAGDVNPGDGQIWIGEAEPTATAIAKGFDDALNSCKPVSVDEIQVVNDSFSIPLDMELLKEQLDAYRSAPEKCSSGEWVDAGFAKAWFDAASTWNLEQSVHKTPMSAIRLGDLALLFHSSELYSFYGLQLQNRSPFETTIAVGYADDSVGYLADPVAYKTKEYAAVTVPRILNLPPFTPNAAAALSDLGHQLLQKLT